MIQIGKKEFINPVQVVSYGESEQQSGAMLHMVNGKHFYCGPDYWPLAKAQLLPANPQEVEALAALRFLNEFNSQIRLTADNHNLIVPEGETVSDALIALAKSLQENGIKAAQE